MPSLAHIPTRCAEAGSGIAPGGAMSSCALVICIMALSFWSSEKGVEASRKKIECLLIIILFYVTYLMHAALVESSGSQASNRNKREVASVWCADVHCAALLTGCIS